MLSREQLAELREDFKYNDADHDGHIDLAEFRALLEALEGGMSDAEIQTGFNEIDLDHDGAIRFDEFVAWWTSD
jgi:Ca2+-binding EF-hand superfamily protein